MRHFRLLLALPFVLGAAAFWAPAASRADDGPTVAKPAVKRALIKTSMGDIEIELWPEVAPQTVRVFLGLANGEGTFTDVRDPNKKVTIRKPFYDGLKFHRVIKGFMLQAGCPRGDGFGGPGFQFADEMSAKALGLNKMKAFPGGRPERAHPWLRLQKRDGRLNVRAFRQTILLPLLKKMGINPSDQAAVQARQQEIMKKLEAMSVADAYELLGFRYDDKLPSKRPLKGYLALANSGPNTNGSQFFINLADVERLSGRHTVFGRVTKGMDVVQKIGDVPVRDPAKQDHRPIKDVKILSIRSIP